MQQPEKGEKKVVKNPYARKRATAANTTARKPAPIATYNGTTITTAGPEGKSFSPQAAPRFVATTFSQAFGSHDDEDETTTNASASVQQAASNTASAGSSSVVASAVQENVDTTAHSSLTDRDTHIVMNQPHVLYVSPKQKGNSILTYIRNVPMAYSRMVPDFIMSSVRCALFLSCKYHALYPQYIHRRIAELGRDFELRVLLVLVDVQDNAKTLQELNKLAVVNDLTMILAWTEEEAGRYLESMKALDGKDASLIQKREQSNFVDQVADFLTACKTINKTDSAALLGQFGSLAKLAQAGPDNLALVVGMGQVKVKRLYEAWQKPFSKKAAKRRKQQSEAKAVEADDDSSSTAKQDDHETDGKANIETIN